MEKNLKNKFSELTKLLNRESFGEKRETPRTLEETEVFPDKISNKERKDIFENGEDIDKLRYSLFVIDLKGWVEEEETKLTKKEEDAIKAIYKKNSKLFDDCLEDFRIMISYGDKVLSAFRAFQVSFSYLAALLNRLDKYYNFMKFLNSLLDVKSLEDKISLLERMTKNGALFLQGATLVYNTESNVLEMDDTDLYEDILKQAVNTNNELADFKAFVKAGMEFTGTTTLKYVPISMEMSIRNAIEERYARFLVNNKKYFLSELFSRLDKGEQVAPEEERYAVIPDYYKTEPNEAVYLDCLEGLKQGNV